MNRIFKLFLSAVLCIAMVLSVCVVSYATDDTITLNYDYSVKDNTLTISGTVASAKGKVPVMMRITCGGEIISYQETVTGSSEKGVCSFGFEAISFSDSDESANYEIYVSADFVRAELTDVYAYKGIDAKFDVVSDFDTAATNDDMITAITNHAVSIGLTDEYLESLSENDMTILAEMLIDADVTCPEDYVAEENISSIAAEIKRATEVAEEAKVVIEACDFAEPSQLEAWVESYGEKYGFTDDMEGTEYDDSKAVKFFEDTNLNDELVTDIAKAAEDARSFDDVTQIILEKSVFKLIGDSNYYMIKNLVEEIPEMFGIETAKLEKLTASQQAEVYKAVALNVSDYETLEDFGDAVNKEVKEVANIDDEDDKRGSGGNRGGGGGSSSSPIGGQLQGGADAEDATSNGQVYIGFTDIEDYEWAREAIEGLYRRGVVNGKDDTHFAPEDKVTRAEFTKMVIEALGIKAVDTNSGFSDVDEDSWYAPYVTAARNNGVVMGDGDKFNPEGAITREDIAVILFRAMEVEEVSDKTIFTDYDDISDYAKDAVIGLFEAGVVNGTGNGAFEPKNSAIRAEAAKMIYLALCQA